MTEHPSENELLDYAEGAMGVAKRSAIDAHLKACSECTALLEAVVTNAGPTGRIAAIDTLLGTKLGDYEVQERIGQGGMGIVYKGWNPVIGKAVAIKVLRPEIAAEAPQQFKRLLAEARAANAIGHRGIIDIFGFGQTPEKEHYIVMELLTGEPLSELMHKKKLTQLQAIALLEGFLGALGSAHAAGVVHRDLKPSNLFRVRQPDGSTFIKILDFGLAKLAEPTGLTAPGIIVGTPEYMAPEQVTGGKVTPQTDLYAVGVIAFLMLTGRRPFVGTPEKDVLTLVQEAPTPRVSAFTPEVHPRFEALIYQLMNRDPAQRAASAEEVAEELARIKRLIEPAADQSLAATEVVSALSGQFDDDEPKPRSKLKKALIAAGIGLSLASALTAFFWWMSLHG